MQLLILDAPASEHPGLGRLLELHDVEPHGSAQGRLAVVGPGDVHVGARQVLLHLEIHHRTSGTQRNVGHLVNVGAVILPGRVLGGTPRWRERQRQAERRRCGPPVRLLPLRLRHRSPRMRSLGAPSDRGTGPRALDAQRTLTFAGLGAPSGPLSQSCALETLGMPHWCPTGSQSHHRPAGCGEYSHLQPRRQRRPPLVPPSALPQRASE